MGKYIPITKTYLVLVSVFVFLRSISHRVPLLLIAFILVLTPKAYANRPPLLNCVANRTTITEGDLVAIKTNATDPDKDPLNFYWSATSGIRPNAVVFSTRNITPQQNGSAVYDSTNVAAGRYTVKAEVSDGTHQTSCSIGVTVRDDRDGTATPTQSFSVPQKSVVQINGIHPDKAAGFAVAVQMAAYLPRAKAEGLRAMLQDQGYTTYVVEADIPGSGRYYRVRVGPFNTLKKARQVMADMHSRVAEQLPDFWIVHQQ